MGTTVLNTLDTRFLDTGDTTYLRLFTGWVFTPTTDSTWKNTSDSIFAVGFDIENPGESRELSTAILGTSYTPEAASHFVLRLLGVPTESSVTPEVNYTTDIYFSSTITNSTNSSQNLAYAVHALNTSIQGISSTPNTTASFGVTLRPTIQNDSLTSTVLPLKDTVHLSAIIDTSSTALVTVTNSSELSLGATILGSSSTGIVTPATVHKLSTTILGTSYNSSALIGNEYLLQSTVLGASVTGTVLSYNDCILYGSIAEQSLTPSSVIGTWRPLSAVIADSSFTPVITNIPGKELYALARDYSSTSVVKPTFDYKYSANISDSTITSTLEIAGTPLVGAIVGTSYTPPVTASKVINLGASIFEVSYYFGLPQIAYKVVPLVASITNSSTTNTQSIHAGVSLYAIILGASTTQLSTIGTFTSTVATIIGGSTTPVVEASQSRRLGTAILGTTNSIDICIVQSRIFGADILGTSTCSTVATGIEIVQAPFKPSIVVLSDTYSALNCSTSYGVVNFGSTYSTVHIKGYSVRTDTPTFESILKSDTLGLTSSAMYSICSS